MATRLNASKVNLETLAKALRMGDLVAIPTETVYGLAADARNGASVEKIYATKQRPVLNPLIAHYPSWKEATKDVHFCHRAQRLAEAFWPGPLTLVLNRNPSCRVVEGACAGLPTLAVRVPAHEDFRHLLDLCGFPVVAPSANPSGRLSPVTADHVAEGLGGAIPWILDGGACSKGVESTIVDLSGVRPILLRAGSITLEKLSQVLGEPCEVHHGSSERPKAPGMKYRHYAPKCPLRLGVENPKEREALLSFGPQQSPKGYHWELNLSPSGDLEEAASKLFAYLHELESLDPTGIAVMDIPNEGVGIAINERLSKAAQAHSGSNLPPKQDNAISPSLSQ